MIGKLKIISRIILQIWGLKSLIIYRVGFKLEKYKNLSAFYEKYKYVPDGLEVNDVSVIRMADSTVLGSNNKILVSKHACDLGRPAIISLGKDCWTGSNVELNVLNGNRILIRDYATIQDNCKLIGDIILEKYTLFAPNVFVSSGNHYAVKDHPDIIRNQDSTHLGTEEFAKNHSKGVHIEEDCWIGYSSFIKQGIYIGRGSIVGSNSVVSKDIPPYSIVVGANQKLTPRFNFTPPLFIDASNLSHYPYFYRGFKQKNGETSTACQGLAIEESSFVVMQKKEIISIKIMGSVSGNEYVGNQFELFIGINNQFESVKSKVEITEGQFSMLIEEQDLKQVSEIDRDYIYRMVPLYNIIHLRYDSKEVSSSIIIKSIQLN